MSKSIELVSVQKVACDGEQTHPLVYYTLKEYKDGQIKAACHYCGKLYLYKDGLDKYSRVNILSQQTQDCID
jgi:uncharacterized Zn-finger protein